MSAPRSRFGRRWLVGGLVVVLIVLLAGVFVRKVILRDRARAVPADEALDVFRDQASSPPQASSTSTAATSPETSVESSAATTPVAATSIVPRLADPGIYTYRTTGREAIDALDGATHDYPAETTITMVELGCGLHLRWDALRERRDEWALCPTADGVEFQPDGVQYHEFFGQPDEEAVSCDHSVLIIPTASARPAQAQQQSCTLADDPWLPSWEILERATRSVAGADVDVQHVRMTIDDNDDYWEHTVVDWYLADTGLPVEVTSTKESRSPSPIGGVVYREEYRLELVSTVPLQ